MKYSKFINEMSLINKNDNFINPNSKKIEIHNDHAKHFHFKSNDFLLKINFDDFSIDYIKKKGKKTIRNKNNINQNTVWSKYELSDEKKLLFQWLYKKNIITPAYTNLEVIKQEYERMN